MALNGLICAEVPLRNSLNPVVYDDVTWTSIIMHRISCSSMNVILSVFFLWVVSNPTNITRCYRELMWTVADAERRQTLILK